MRNIVLIVLLQLFLCTVMAKEELLKVISASVSPSLIGGFSGVLGPQQVQSKGDDNSMASLSCLLSLQRLKNSRSLIQNSTSLGELGKALCGIQPQVTRDVQDFYSSPIDLNKNKMKHLQKLLESLKIQRNNGAEIIGFSTTQLHSFPSHDTWAKWAQLTRRWRSYLSHVHTTP